MKDFHEYYSRLKDNREVFSTTNIMEYINKYRYLLDCEKLKAVELYNQGYSYKSINESLSKKTSRYDIEEIMRLVGYYAMIESKYSSPLFRYGIKMRVLNKLAKEFQVFDDEGLVKLFENNSKSFLINNLGSHTYIDCYELYLKVKKKEVF